MGKRMLGCLVLAICMLGLGGCMFGNVDEMYALPKSSEAYVNLQAKINQEKGSAEYIAPLSGENRQTIQLVDVDGDGVQEAVAFFRDTTSENPLKIVIFKQDEHEEYQVYTRIEGVGSEIESIDYLDLGGSGGMDILVSWQVSGAVHTLVGYTLAEEQPVEIMRSGYSQYLATDLDGDGKEEIVLAQAESGSKAQLRIEYYDGRDGLITDVFYLEEGHGLKNIAMDPETRRSKNVFHYYAGVQPEDIDGDGCMDVPVAQSVPAYGESSADRFWWLQWMHYRVDGSRDLVMTTYHSGDGWYLEIPEDWTGEFSMRRQESSTIGVRTVTFARGEKAQTEAEESKTVPFLEISCLVGSDRTRQARQGNRFILYADSTTIYTAEFLESGWDCGLDQEGLKARFHAGLDGWNTRE